ncbi:MAG: protein kinase [Magnetospirillum sp.]|nr:protein kinase [Magnetospirillum sp.]
MSKGRIEAKVLWGPAEGFRFPGAQTGVDYILQKYIGGGGFGGVFRADRVVDDRAVEVAVKLVLLDPSDPRDMTRKLNELQAVAGLRHPHIVSSPAHGGGFVSLEPLKGRPLCQFLELELADHDLTEGIDAARADLRTLAVHLCRGLAFLHDRPQPVVHRDLKPENVLWFAAEQRWKLEHFPFNRGHSRQQRSSSGSRPV